MTLWEPSVGCAFLTKFKKFGKTWTRTQKAGRGLGYFYSILGVYDAFDPGLGLENQSDLVYDIWERYWGTYSIIIDYYEKYPDQDVILFGLLRMIKMMMMVMVTWVQIQVGVKRMVILMIELGIICLTRLLFEWTNRDRLCLTAPKNLFGP